jgi:hypothetical protein
MPPFVVLLSFVSFENRIIDAEMMVVGEMNLQRKHRAVFGIIFASTAVFEKVAVKNKLLCGEDRQN